MKKIYFILVMSWLIFYVSANPIEIGKAKQVAQNFLSAQGKASVSLLNVTPAQYSELYVFTSLDNGYVIVAADDCAKPILGYSTTGTFSPTEMPSSLIYWLHYYEQQIQWAKTARVSSATTLQAWQQWLSPSGNTPRYASSVSPLLTTLWSQRPYYNELCPEDFSLYTGHPTTGCTATAMAQVMKYWNHPRHGYSQYSYSWQGVQPYWTYGTLSADFENTEYQWNSMPNMLDWSSTPEQIFAVAQLMSHVGISIQMSYNIYGDGGSDAPVALLEFSDPMYVDHTYCPENALPKFFGYKPSLRGLAREGFADTLWDNMLREDISNGRPVLYGGFGVDPITGESNGGHSFVLDGYDNNGLFHVNWGWGEGYNGYYPTTALDVGYYSFSDRQEAIFGIEPDYCHLEMAGSLQATVAISSIDFERFEYILTNKGDSAFDGKIGVGIWDEQGNYLGLCYQKDIHLDSQCTDYYCDDPLYDGSEHYNLSFSENAQYTAVLMFGDTLAEYPVYETSIHLNHSDFVFTINGEIEDHQDNIPNVFTQGCQVVVENEQMAPITVYDALGKILYQNAHPQTETRIPMNTSGVYLVRVGDYTAKIVISKTKQ